MEYQQPDNDSTNYDYDQNDGYANQSNGNVKGLKIAIYILLVVLLAVGFLYYRSVQQANSDAVGMKAELDSVAKNIELLQVDMKAVDFKNDSLNRTVDLERHRADSLVDRIKKERNISYSKLKAYERELGTLRSTMQTFVRQIDSLSRLNQKLLADNVDMRKQIATYRTRTDAAEEKASELNHKIARGAQIRARDIKLTIFDKRKKEVTKAARATGFKVSFILSANELATPGERRIYACIVNPEGIVLAENQSATFSYEGQNKQFTASREIDYQLEDLGVDLVYNGTGITAGSYNVMLYMDGNLVGNSSVIFR